MWPGALCPLRGCGAAVTGLLPIAVQRTVVCPECNRVHARARARACVCVFVFVFVCVCVCVCVFVCMCV